MLYPVKNNHTYCNQTHQLIQIAPLEYLHVLEHEQNKCTVLNHNTCILNQEDHFITGVLRIPVIGTNASLIYKMWVYQSANVFDLFTGHLRGQTEGIISNGTVSTELLFFKDTSHNEMFDDVDCDVEWGNSDLIAKITIEDANHPLYKAQHDGISQELFDSIRQDHSLYSTDQTLIAA